jgi:hypothetical protein
MLLMLEQSLTCRFFRYIMRAGLGFRVFIDRRFAEDGSVESVIGGYTAHGKVEQCQHDAD